MGPLTLALVIGGALGLFVVLAQFVLRRTKAGKQKVLQHENYIIEQVHFHKADLEKAIKKLQKKNDFGVILKDKSHEAIDEFLWSISWNKNLIDKYVARDLVRKTLDYIEDDSLL